MIDGPPPFLGHVKAGRVRALAVANDKRLEQMPEVPTFAESGYSGMEAGLWYGMLAPKATPLAIVDRLLDDTVEPGNGEPSPSFGIGLSNTRERLASLYGNKASLTFQRNDGQGARVDITMPLRRSGAHE